MINRLSSATCALVLMMAQPAIAQLQSSPLKDKTPDTTAASAGVSSGNCFQPQKMNGEYPTKLVTIPDDTRPDLVIDEAIAMSRLEFNTIDKTTTIGVFALVNNTGFCNAGTSRMKGILTLNGGRWIGESRQDVAVGFRDQELVEFTITFAYEELLVDCTLTRDDWRLTMTADLHDEISETDETNNSSIYSFSTASADLCPVFLKQGMFKKVRP